MNLRALCTINKLERSKSFQNMKSGRQELEKCPAWYLNAPQECWNSESRSNPSIEYFKLVCNSFIEPDFIMYPNKTENNP